MILRSRIEPGSIWARVENEDCLIYRLQVYRLQGGKIVEITEYCDSALCESVLGTFPAARNPTVS
jgi:hypothetical protein